MKHTYRYNVVQTVEVVLNDEDVNQEYLDAFSDMMWAVDSIEDIAEHIARSKALFDGYSIEFAPNNYEAEIIDDYVEEAY